MIWVMGGSMALFLVVIVGFGVAVVAELLGGGRRADRPRLRDADVALAVDAARQAAYAQGQADQASQTFDAYIAAGLDDVEAFANGERRQP